MSRRWLALSTTLLTACAPTAGGGPTETPPVAAPIADASSGPVAAPTTTAAATPPPAAAPPSDGAVVRTMFVDAKRVPCEGEGLTECLRVRGAPTEEWTLFYRTIEGFTFEPGHTYELRVEVTPAPNRPADASSLRHRLVELVSKKAAP